MSASTFGAAAAANEGEDPTELSFCSDEGSQKSRPSTKKTLNLEQFKYKPAKMMNGKDDSKKTKNVGGDVTSAAAFERSFSEGEHKKPPVVVGKSKSIEKPRTKTKIVKKNCIVSDSESEQEGKASDNGPNNEKGHRGRIDEEYDFEGESPLKNGVSSSASINICLADGINKADCGNSSGGKKKRAVIRSSSSSSSSDSEEIVAKNGDSDHKAPIKQREGQSGGNLNRSQGRTTKIDIEIEHKEKSLREVCRVFPKLDYMEVQDLLVIHNWSSDSCIKYLKSKRNHSESDSDSDIQTTNHNNFKKRKRIKSMGSLRKNGANKSDNDSERSKHYKDKKFSKKSRKKKRRTRSSGDESGSNSGGSYKRTRNVVYDSDASDDENNAVTPSRQIVLDFYQNAKMEELLTVPRCSKAKASVILELRPFSGWLDLVFKFKSGRSLTTDLLNSAKELINSREIVSKLMLNCERLSKKMEMQVSRLMNEEDVDEDGHLKEQPSLLNSSLKLAPYQLLGVNWIVLLHRQKVNGILADEMGLGKTIQAIAFLTYLLEEGDEGPHLIVVPASTIDNWARELNTWSSKLQVLLYNGSQNERKQIRRDILTGKESSFNVIVTTYNLVTSSSEDRSLFRRVLFHYVVFDEAHLLKNMGTQRYQQLMRINANRRLLLTGTPLQNNLIELMSLLVFVMPNMFDGKQEHLKMMFTMVSKDDREETKGLFEKDRIAHASQIMKPFVLRRLKCDVLRDLPKKKEEIVFCPMNENQNEQYTGLVHELARKAREDRENAVFTRSGAGYVMQLRRLANHPLLMRYLYTDETLTKMSKLMLKEPTHCEANSDLILEDMQVMSDFELHKLCGNFKSISSFALESRHISNSGKFSYLDDILPDMKSKGDRVLLFSQFVMVLDIVEEYMKLNGHKYVRLDGSTPVSERLVLIDRYTNDASIFIFLLSTKAGGLGINLTVANTVILHDIDFNPYNDKQAEDRCHRVGQVKDVNVIRLISKETIEEDILRLATKKLKLEKDLTSIDSGVGDVDTKNVASLLKKVLGL